MTVGQPPGAHLGFWDLKNLREFEVFEDGEFERRI